MSLRFDGAKKGGAIMPTLAEQWFQEGMEKGIKKGLKEGLIQGIEKGFEKGIEKGVLIPAKVGIQPSEPFSWIPTFAGMTGGIVKKYMLGYLEKSILPSSRKMHGAKDKSAKVQFFRGEAL
jgi:hypothetical protein